MLVGKVRCFLFGRSFVTWFVSICLHIAVILVGQRAGPSIASPHVPGMHLPPIAVEVMIQSPELPVHEIAPEKKIQKLRALVKNYPNPDAPLLLTPPPFPKEYIGAEPSFSVGLIQLLERSYFPASTLSIRPTALTEPVLELPDGWLEAFGQAKLTLYLNVEGEVDDVFLINTNLPSELHEAIRESFKKLLFSPGKINDTFVPSSMTIEANISASLGSKYSVKP